MPNISIKVRGLDAIREFIDKLPLKVRGIATEEVAKYLIGDGRRGLRRYPPYKHITRRAAYGNVSKDGAPPGFFSKKQWRYVMWKISKSEIDPGYPHRTGNYQRGWEIQNTGAKTKIVNAVPYARFVGGDEDQARLNEKVGWRRVRSIPARGEGVSARALAPASAQAAEPSVSSHLATVLAAAGNTGE